MVQTRSYFYIDVRLEIFLYFPYDISVLESIDAYQLQLMQ